ncbi:hypothetical protein [Actinacidiphila sp. bgisy145]|uniref:hypothetical protein n=1 Tax=Actinacidiphila sp. bgisy145 TaxID=3413792 RepID=UPI003EB88DBC
MLNKVRIRGWSVVGTGEPTELEPRWRHRDDVPLPADRWSRAQGVAPGAPVGEADRLLVLRATGARPVEIEFVLGSQGSAEPSRTAPAERITLAPSETLMLDARLWWRGDASDDVVAEIWEQI